MTGPLRSRPCRTPFSSWDARYTPVPTPGQLQQDLSGWMPVWGPSPRRGGRRPTRRRARNSTVSRSSCSTKSPTGRTSARWRRNTSTPRGGAKASTNSLCASTGSGSRAGKAPRGGERSGSGPRTGHRTPQLRRRGRAVVAPRRLQASSKRCLAPRPCGAVTPCQPPWVPEQRGQPVVPQLRCHSPLRGGDGRVHCAGDTCQPGSTPTCPSEPAHTATTPHNPGARNTAQSASMRSSSARAAVARPADRRKPSASREQTRAGRSGGLLSAPRHRRNYPQLRCHAVPHQRQPRLRCLRLSWTRDPRSRTPDGSAGQ